MDGNLTHLNLPSCHREVPSEKKLGDKGDLTNSGMEYIWQIHIWVCHSMVFSFQKAISIGKKSHFNRENDDQPGNFGAFFFETSPYMPMFDVSFLA